MTEGLLVQHDKPMCVRIWLEVGHACEPRRSAMGRALAVDWRLWVRGARGSDISAFVHKVVFQLRPASAFVYPKRVLQEPPYEIQESGNVSIDIPIHVYLKHSSEPRKISLRYSLEIENQTRSSTESRRLFYDVENPGERLCRALMRGGAEVVARARRRRDDVCARCGESTHADFRRQLRAAGMSDAEVQRAAKLYLAQAAYARAPTALPLPPLSDPIYRPELPPSLRDALKAARLESW